MTLNQFREKIKRFWQHWFLEETRWIGNLIWPNLVTNQCFQFILTIGPIIFAGKVMNSTTTLAGVTLCVSFFLIVAFMPLYGMASAFDTLATQAFGARDYKMLGVYLQRGLLILSVLCMPIAALLLQMDQFMILLGEDPAIVQVCATMMQYSVLILPFLTLAAFLKIAEAQSIVIPTAVLLFVGSLLDVAATLLILYLISSSVVSLVAGIVFSLLVTFLIFLAYLYCSGALKQIWGGFTWRMFSGWGEIFLLGVPISIGIITDAVVTELGCFLVGLGQSEPAVEIAIYSVLVCMNDLLEMCSYAVYTGISIRVGNLVGEGNIPRSRLAALTGVILSLSLTSLLLLVICIPKNYIGYLFISNKEVVEGISELILYLIPTSLLMALVYALNGVVSGYGKQWVIVVQVVVALIVGLPISLVLTGYGWGARGYWIGVIAGYIAKSLVTLLINLYYIVCAKIMRTSSERMNGESVALISHSKGKSKEKLNKVVFKKRGYSLNRRFSKSSLKRICSLIFTFSIIFISASFLLSVVICKFSRIEHVFHVHKPLHSDARICCMKFVFNASNSTNSTGW